MFDVYRFHNRRLWCFYDKEQDTFFFESRVLVDKSRRRIQVTRHAFKGETSQAMLGYIISKQPNFDPLKPVVFCLSEVAQKKFDALMGKEK